MPLGYALPGVNTPQWLHRAKAKLFVRTRLDWLTLGLFHVLALLRSDLGRSDIT